MLIGKKHGPVSSRIAGVITAILVATMVATPAAVGQGDAAEASSLPDWLQRFRLAGNTDVAYFKGEGNSLAPDGSFDVENARFFLDVDLGGKWSLFFEWDLVREAEVKNEMGSLYVRADGLFGKDALNLKVGRFPIPFGVEYLRFHEQRPENPLISYSAGVPYNWDEGIELFGSVGKLAYNFALQDGDDELDENTDSEPQVTLRLKWQATDWAQLLLSGVDSGPVAKAALEWGGTHPRPFGAGSDVVSYQSFVPIDDDSAGDVSVTGFEGDLILEPGRSSRFWLAYGRVDVESSALASFDRELTYYVAEARVDVGPKYYLAARYSAIGTGDEEKGYLLEAMNGGDDLGYNTENVSTLSLGAGVRLENRVTLKAEYSAYEFDLVHGAPAELRARTRNRDYFAVALSVHF